jgi:addiction module RelE/StbE family toxin
MKAVWTRAAIRDLAHLPEYIAQENPDAARETASKIVDATDRIVQFPEVGRVGRMKGTRELVVSGTQYLIVYRLKKNAIHFLRVLHGHQNWPKGDL